MKLWKIAGIGFDHMHMGDLLRMVQQHAAATLCGVMDSHAEKMIEAAQAFSIPENLIFTDLETCLSSTKPDIVLLCTATANHRTWLERIAPFGVHVLVEKPFASNLADADAMISAMHTAQKNMVINWPMVWYASHAQCKKTIDSGVIGEPLEVHYYGGNRGPLFHVADKAITQTGNTLEEKKATWWYQPEQGGGSLQDYLGYGTTLGTWFLNGKVPLEVTAMGDTSMGLTVDEHSVVVARYATGLSKFETRWGTFTDPWKHQPQPKCGFVVVGTEGTLSSYDLEKTILIQTRNHPEGYWLPVESLQPPYRNPIQYFIHCLEENLPMEGPLSPAISRIGQRIVDAAVKSIQLRRTVQLSELV